MQRNRRREMRCIGCHQIECDLAPARPCVGGAPVWQLQANSMQNTAPIGFMPMVPRFGLQVVKPTVHRREAGWGPFDILHGSIVSKPMLTRRKAGMGQIVTVLLLRCFNAGTTLAPESSLDTSEPLKRCG